MYLLVPDLPIEYDAFIAYSSEDEDFVRDTLMDKLEEKKYNICVDFKDFTPGKLEKNSKNSEFPISCLYDHLPTTGFS